jgi:hypothetical protein
MAHLAVHIGARIAALAGAGEMLVSSTVPDRWRIYRVTRSPLALSFSPRPPSGV